MLHEGSTHLAGFLHSCGIGQCTYHRHSRRRHSCQCDSRTALSEVQQDIRIRGSSLAHDRLTMIGIALIVMAVASLMHHLGLSEAIADVVSKIAGCSKCLTFWSVLAVLILSGCNILIAVAAAIVMAYLSHWFGFVLILCNRLYDRVWKSLQRKNLNRRG